MMILSLFIAACGEDNNPTTPQPSNETLIFSMDSLAYAVLDSGWYGIPIDTLVTINDAKKIKVTFTGETNIDSTNGLFTAASIISFNNNAYFCNEDFTTYSEFAKEHSYTCNYFENTVAKIALFVELDANYTHTYKYIRMKNIKIYKVTS